jgi:hemerythrin
MITWTPALGVGVPELDAQHQELFRRADAFLVALRSSTPGDVARLLDFLCEHARVHFEAEEAWLRGAAYPGLEAHQAEHRAFLADLSVHVGRAGGSREPALEVAAWLVGWLHDHVARADGAAARWVLDRGRLRARA